MPKTSNKEAPSNLLAVIRVRGRVDVRPEVKHTLSLLRLHKSNHCVLVKNGTPVWGMLQVAKDWITWGEINRETLEELLKKRAYLSEGNKGLSEEYVKENTSHDSMDDLIEALLASKVNIKQIKGLKPVFRLNPPRKGYSGVKKSYTKGGALGYRGKAINELLRQMI
ncbi:MAG: 50S ribosomal protein L30 [Candidatus Heimdallarchaeota archaeon]